VETIHPGVTGRADPEPLTVTFKVASRITGLGNTTLWGLAKRGLIKVIRPPGTRRTLIYYPSIKELLSPEKDRRT
jgi:hypothetical protein